MSGRGIVKKPCRHSNGYDRAFNLYWKAYTYPPPSLNTHIQNRVVNSGFSSMIEASKGAYNFLLFRLCDKKRTCRVLRDADKVSLFGGPVNIFSTKRGLQFTIHDLRFTICFQGKVKAMNNKKYIEQRNGGYYISGKRISLDSIVYAFKRGSVPESIQRSFPLLTLEEVYGAITFYLANEAEIDEYLKNSEAEFEAFSKSLRQADPEWYAKMRKAREDALVSK
jgi:uncharacterized protein (DUF433 family)